MEKMYICGLWMYYMSENSKSSFNKLINTKSSECCIFKQTLLRFMV